jgi:hypothetical protein
MIAGWTFDRTDVPEGQPAVGWDVDIPTWDGGLFGGFTQWTQSFGPREVIPLSNVRTQAFQYDRRMFRAPFGTTVWHQEGDGRRGVQLVNVSVDVIDDANGITDAAFIANALANVAQFVTEIECPYGKFDVLALSSFTRSPIESGYRFNFAFGTLNGLRL